MYHFHYYNKAAAILMVLMFLSGCGTVEHKITFDQQYSMQPGTKVELGTVKNQTGQNFDIDVEKMLADALTNALKKKNLQWTEGAGPRLVLTADIVEYAKGDAFKRWLMPGYGSTTLVVRSALNDSDNRKVGSVDAKRTVDAGGAYTIGAWETIFQNVAEDIVANLAEQVK
ncbi:MAG TPA: hypothetical protein DDY20_02640 [Desulfobulbaceae bacterium]|nr:hypothetical protein [Desulfobulbaceae bacterium]